MNKKNIEKEEFIRVGTTLYKLVNQPRLNGGHVKKTHRMDHRFDRHSKRVIALTNQSDKRRIFVFSKTQQDVFSVTPVLPGN